MIKTAKAFADQPEIKSNIKEFKVGPVPTLPHSLAPLRISSTKGTTQL